MVSKARWTLAQTVKTWQLAFQVVRRTGSVAYLKGKRGLNSVETSGGFCMEHATRGPCRYLKGGRRKHLMHVSLVFISAFLLAAPALGHRLHLSLFRLHRYTQFQVISQSKEQLYSVEESSLLCFLYLGLGNQLSCSCEQPLPLNRHCPHEKESGFWT